MSAEGEAQQTQQQKQKTIWGIVHIYSSYNNILITVTDITGSETIAKASGGMFVTGGRMEASPYAAMRVASYVMEIAKAKGIKQST